jgi:hypothetical protein
MVVFQENIFAFLFLFCLSVFTREEGERKDFAFLIRNRA